MGEKQKTWIFWGVLGLAFAAGLALAVMRADLAYVVRPTIGVMMIAAGLFFMFGRVWLGPLVTDAEHALRRRTAGAGMGYVLFGIGNLLPSGWASAACIWLAAAIIWASLFGFPARIFATR